MANEIIANESKIGFSIPKQFKKIQENIKTCPNCDMLFHKQNSLEVWTNYGGKPKKHLVCSTNCQETMLNGLGDRAAKSKAELKVIRFW